MHVLIAEDNANTVAGLRCFLEPQGHVITTVSDGVQAWEILKKNLRHRVDIFVCSSELAETEPLELCERIRRNDNTARVYCILLTDSQTPFAAALADCPAIDDCLDPRDPARDIAARMAVARRTIDLRTQLDVITEKLDTLQDEYNSQNDLLTNALAFTQVANRRFSELFMGMPIPCITCDQQGRIQEWNRACETVLGATPSVAFQSIYWETFSCTTDKTVIRKTIQKALKGKAIENTEWHYLHPDGHERNMLCSAFPLHLPDGTIVGVITTHVDVTERRQLELHLDAHHPELRRRKAS